MDMLNIIPNHIGLNGITEEDARRILRRYRYHFKVPLLATITPEELELFGVPVDVKPDGTIEHTADKRMSSVYYNLEQILDIYNNGDTIILEDRDKLTEILEVLSQVANMLEGNTIKLDNEYIETIDNFIKEVLNFNRKTIETKVKQEKENKLKESGLVSGIEIDDTPVNTAVSYKDISGIKVDQW